jgi:fatty-acyl-CoA synthase
MTYQLTIHSVFERLESWYGDGLVIDAGLGIRRTYAEFCDRVRRLCTVLVDELGVAKGDRVATFSWNNVNHLELYWALPLVGAVLHTLNIRLFPEQVRWIVDHAEDKVILADPLLAADAPSPHVLFDDLDRLVEKAEPMRAFPPVGEHDPLGLAYTSGTTGDPKGVIATHRGTWTHAMGACMADSLAISESDRVMPIAPLFHAWGWGMPYASAMTGAEIVVHGRDTSADNIGSIIERERVTVAGAVPTIWKELLPLARAGKYDLSSLRLVFVGGSASPRSLIEAYRDLGINYTQVWGMTETGPIACVANPRRGVDDVLDYTGTITPGVEGRVVDGELQVRGPWIAEGYHRVSAFEDGWLPTGDMAEMEPNGLFRIVDRAKDLVKSGGEWISSVELEGLLLAHPDVRDCAVVGVRSRKWDERPVAVVVPESPGSAENGGVTLESLHEFLGTKVAKWWLPDEVVTVAEIPKTGVGKIDKKAIRNQLSHLELP